MTRTEPTDLICRARRRELNPDERRQLQDLVQRSGEMRLLSVMLSEFERESQVRPGDDVLLARIGERALELTTKAPPRRRRPARFPILLAAALMLLGGAAWALRAMVEASRAKDAPDPAPSAPTEPPARRGKLGPTRAEAPIDAPPRDEPMPEPRESVPTPEPRAPRAPTSGSVLNGAPPRTFNPASDLFARANALRRQGRTAEAAALYELIVDDHPGSREAPPARLALAKILRTRAPARALAHFRELARQGGALRAEALWGMAESARTLGDGALEARALSDLLREFPGSPYADAARGRTLYDSR